MLKHVVASAVSTMPLPFPRAVDRLLPSVKQTSVDICRLLTLPHPVQGDGDYEIVDDFIIDDFLRQKLKVSEDELLKERACVGHLIPGDEAAACEITVDTMLPGEN